MNVVKKKERRHNKYQVDITDSTKLLLNTVNVWYAIKPCVPVTIKINLKIQQTLQAVLSSKIRYGIYTSYHRI